MHFSLKKAPLGQAVAKGNIPFWLPLLLGCLTAVGPVSTDIYLPALPEMERQLGAPSGSGSWTMAAWVAGLAVGQIAVGPITDRFGRRLPLLIGTLGYTLAAAGCALAPNMTSLCLFRILAALMAAASLVVPNACIRDLTEGDASSRMMSRLIVVQGVVPILAPALGGFALQFVGWRDIFWATAIYGVLGLGLVTLFLPETLAPAHRQNLRFLPILARYVATFRDRSYRYNGLVWMVQGFIVFTYLTAAPFLFEDVFGLTPLHYGMLFGLFAVFMIGSSQVNAMLVGRFRSQSLLRLALLTSFAGGTGLLALALWSGYHLDEAGHLENRYLWPMIILMLVTLGPGGAIGPNAAAGALVNQAENAGTATALAGTGQYVTGMMASALFSFLPVGTAIPMAIMLLGAIIVMMICASLAPPPECTI